MKYTPAKPSIYGEDLDGLTASLKAAGHQAFRARQVMDWLYKKRVTSWEGMTNLPKPMRAWLGEQYELSPLRRVITKAAGDVTEKLLFRLGDGQHIETVLIRYPQQGVGLDDARKTVCISTQVGCAYGCKFCASGLAGWKRDLHPAEIAAQLVEVCLLEDAREGRPADGGATFDNLVVMGMGEPLANYDALMRAILILNADWGLRFGARRITVSTSGLVPQIRQLAEEPIQFRLAISLHGATNEVRSQIMPINRRYPLEELIPAAQEFAGKHGRMLTLEYILIEEVNDLLSEARALVKIARDLHAHVNLIPYNRVDGLSWKRPNLRRQHLFADVLRQANVSCTVRKEKGHDIDAACGQLRLRQEESAAERMSNGIGAVRSGVGDLSTNPKHMEGFGCD